MIPCRLGSYCPSPLSPNDGMCLTTARCPKPPTAEYGRAKEACQHCHGNRRLSQSPAIRRTHIRPRYDSVRQIVRPIESDQTQRSWPRDHRDGCSSA
ncbi:unnamed protein product [Didymodactylos carnosus]|uniref:Uncharacterized protein n=1 Tax=Didymodactylos carnosus TaxID=1234261 RepID=A0A814DFA0_9BILA|nr:unnamed protein product [Didymodactylos carnosus]CAF0956292.1 unnamed protein product [Didymodactylos carnosus]CAF3639481.1 unnamed protein product [Didymodactylos carnosus]CAF3731274.1 unnamed protein product [Didymodactylos carnosus]